VAEAIPYYLQAPDAPAAPERPSEFGDLSTKIAGAYEGLLDARRNQERVLEKQAAEQAPKIERAQAQISAIAQEGAARTATVEAAKPAITPPPTHQLHEFLAPVQGESPEASVLKMIQGIGLLAGSIGGLARGDARGSLAALKGALAGWSEGDAARADRAFKDWKAKTDAALAKWQIERETYEGWFKNANMSADMMLKGFELDAIRYGNDKAVAAARSGRFEDALKWLTDLRKHEDDVALRLATIESSYTRAREHDQTLREIADMRVQIAQDQHNQVLAQYTPEVLRSEGQRYALTGKTQAAGLRGKTGELVMGMIRKSAIDWAHEQGIDPMMLPGIQADINAARSALPDTMKRRNFAVANATVFERHFDTLLKLSEKLDRTQMPAINSYIVQGRRDWKGDPLAAQYIVQAYEVAQEFAKLMVGTAQGDEASRQEARKAIATGLTHEQLVAIGQTLKTNAANRVAGWDETLKASTDLINDAARGKPRAVTPGHGATLPEGLPDPATHKDKIVRDTQTGKRYRSNGTTWEPLP
jgi:hypothetical protein